MKGRILACTAVLAAACVSTDPPTHAFFPFESLRGVMFTPPQVLAGAQRAELGFAPNAIVLAIDENNSYRAVANAVLDVRERGLAVGYWIDCAFDDGAAGRAPDVETRISRAVQLVRTHVSSDAIFLAHLDGSPAACGCASNLCCAPGTTRALDESTRILQAVRAVSRGALVVPVWLDGCAPGADECKARRCAGAECEAIAKRAWENLCEHALRVGLLLQTRASARSTSARDPDWVASRLRAWSRPTGGAKAIVLIAEEFTPVELADAVASVNMARRTGLLIGYVPSKATTDPGR